MNLGVDVFARRVTPERYQPGIGLRPGPGPERGGDRRSSSRSSPRCYAAAYESIAAHSRLGLNVVSRRSDTTARSILTCSRDCARRLDGLPVLFVGVRCPIEVIMERRAVDVGRLDTRPLHSTNRVRAGAVCGRKRCTSPGIYDLEVDTSVLSAEECAEAIRRRLDEGPPGDAFLRLAQ